MKKCTKCDIKKKLSEFHKQKRSKDGVRSVCKSCRKVKYVLNADKERQRVKDYYLKNSDKVKKYQKEYKKKNRELINKRNRAYKRNKRATDEIFLIKENISCLIRNTLKLYNHKKNTKTEVILGISINEFKAHLNNNPYGFTYNDKDIDLDHIIPISKANTEEEAIDLNYYKNFQLLPKEYNRNIKKDSNFNRIDFENWYYGARAVEKVTKIRKNK